MYAALEDIQKIVPDDDLIQLTDDNLPPVEIMPEIVDRAISDAGDIIDGYLRRRYRLPFAAVPGLLNTLAVDIAVYRLYSRRIRLSAPEGVAERYKNALRLLEKIASGDISIGPDENAGVAAAPGAAFFPGPPRKFRRAR